MGETTSAIRVHLAVVVIVVALGSLVTLGTISYHYLENWDWVDSFYFTVCTLTTIGYGDLTPTSDASRMFTALFALAGVGVAFGSFGALGAIYLRRGERILIDFANGNTRQRRS